MQNTIGNTAVPFNNFQCNGISDFCIMTCGGMVSCISRQGIGIVNGTITLLMGRVCRYKTINNKITILCCDVDRYSATIEEICFRNCMSTYDHMV